MPASPALADGLADELVDIYAEAEQLMLERISRSLAAGIEAPGWAEVKLLEIQLLQASLNGAMRDTTAKSSEALASTLARAYNRGQAGAHADLAELVRRGIGGAQAQTSGLRAITALVGETTGQLRTVEQRVLRAVPDAYRAIVREASSQVLTGTQTRRQVTQKALNRLADAGIGGFTDARGRSWALESYVEMATRTAAGRAAIAGHTDRLQSAGHNLVTVSDAPQECSLCRPFEGRVFTIDRAVAAPHDVDVLCSLDEARARGLFHPNCRHSTALYLPGISRLPQNTADPQGDRDRQELRRLERKVRAAKRREVVALDPDAQARARADVRAAQAQIRQHVDTSTAKRVTAREQLVTPAATAKRRKVEDLGRLSDDELDERIGAEFTKETGPDEKLLERLSLQSDLRERYTGPTTEGTGAATRSLTRTSAVSTTTSCRPPVDQLLGSPDPDAHAYVEAALEELRLRRYARKGFRLPKARGALRAPKEESRTAKIRRLRDEWEEQLRIEALDLENATNGNLIRRDRLAEFNEKHGPGRQMTVIMEADPVTAYYYASEEVRRYWESHPGARMTFAEYAEQAGMDGDRAITEAAEKARQRRRTAAARAEERPGRKRRRR